ncbi:MAG: CHAT domain-containing protein [Cytophagales bacterium]|nr:CHAT domain-containing protein [Cytophagales bacterium]
MAKTILFYFLSFSYFISSGQTCLQKLDSADYFKYLNPQKSKFYATSLLADLEAEKCVAELGTAGLYNNVGLILWEVNDKQKGLNAFLSGLSHEIAIKDSTHQDLMGLYYNLSALYREIGSFNESGRYLNLVGKIVDSWYQNDPTKQTEYLNAKGTFNRDIGDFDKSLGAFNDALDVLESGSDSIEIALQIELGTTYRHFGDLDRSEQELLKAIDLAKGKNKLQYFRAMDRLSSLKIEQGEYSDSENYLLHNLERKRKLYSDDPLLLLETLNGLGGLYYKLNDLVLANEYLTDALKTTEDIRTIRPYMLNNLGTIYMKQGDLGKAEEYFLSSSEGFENLFGSMNPDYASSLNNLAGIYKQKGELSEALNLYTRVLDMDKVIYGVKHPRYATSLNNVALLYLQLGHSSLAGKLLQEAKKIRSESLGEYHPLYIKSVNDLALYHLINEDIPSALDELNVALKSEIKHMQDIFPVLTDNQRKLYFNETRSNVERFCSLTFREEFINTPYAEDALNHFINTKGILFYASEKMRTLIQNSADERTKKVYEQWRQKKYKLAQSYLLTQEERRRHGISINVLEDECNQLEKELSLKFKVFSDQEKAAYHKWNEISKALEDSSAMIDIIHFREYRAKVIDEEIIQGFTDVSKYVAFILKPDDVLVPVRWSDDVDFDKSFSNYRNSLKFGLKDKTSYESFWEPMDQHLSDTRKIYLSPDGIFHKLNPAVFFNNNSISYLSDQYDILNVTSGKDLLNRQPKRLIRNAQIFGNPDFSTLTIDEKLKQLPGAELEAKDITGILDVRKWKSDTYYYSEATEEQIKSLTNPGVVHIATHGYFDDDPNHVEPLHSSGLFLSKNINSQNDGRLSAYEAMNLQLDQTNVVVLAACETGLGKVKNGEGVFGLQRAFLVAGADNVLISLVKINDKAARNFMNMFYKELIEVEDAQEAFFNARAAYKKTDSNPYNWGAYILVSKG